MNFHLLPKIAECGIISISYLTDVIVKDNWVLICFRLHTEYHKKRYCELCRAGNLWHHQRAYIKIQSHDRWITSRHIIQMFELLKTGVPKFWHMLICRPPADNLPCHFTAALGAGFCTTIVASPVDVVKTRFMNSTASQYNSAINCALTMLTKEGPTAFYKGWAKPFKPVCVELI